MNLESDAESQTSCSEFGRPVLTGFFRTLTVELPLENGTHEIRGYHKPILIAGGMGTVRPQFALKDPAIVPSGSVIVVLGGPSMLIGLGGGSASSAASAEGSADLVRLFLAPGLFLNVLIPFYHSSWAAFSPPKTYLRLDMSFSSADK